MKVGFKKNNGKNNNKKEKNQRHVSTHTSFIQADLAMLIVDIAIGAGFLPD